MITLFFFFYYFKDNISNLYYSPHYPVNTLDINPNVMITKENIEDQFNELLYFYNQQNNNLNN